MKWILFILTLISFACTENIKEPASVVFDIPVLYYKNIDEVRVILGSPLDNPPDPLHPRISENSNTFEKDGHSLVVKYDIETRRIKRFFLVSVMQYENSNNLLRMGNLDSTDISEYSIEVENPLHIQGYTAFSVNK